MTEGWSDLPESMSPHVVGLTRGSYLNLCFLLDTKLGVVFWEECHSDVKRNPSREPIFGKEYDNGPTEEETDFRCDSVAWAIPDFLEFLKDLFQQLFYVPVSPRVVSYASALKEVMPILEAIYREHGWPDLERYRKQECLNAVQDLMEWRDPDRADRRRENQEGCICQAFSPFLVYFFYYDTFPVVAITVNKTRKAAVVAALASFLTATAAVISSSDDHTGLHPIVAPTAYPDVTESTDPWRCATEDPMPYLSVPMPSGKLQEAYESFGDSLIETCLTSGTYASPCAFPDKSRWCGFTTAVPASLLSDYTAYARNASSWWVANSGSVVRIASECPIMWYKASNFGVLGGAVFLNHTLINAECYAEANPTVTEPTTGPTATPAQGTGESKSLSVPQILNRLRQAAPPISAVKSSLCLTCPS
ncbi:hypothetical protein VTI28DRAFT_7640 [Corynascus sepedonium]